MVHPTSEVLHEQQRDSSVFSEPPVREADAVRLDELCRGSDVRVRHGWVLSQ